MSSPEQRIRRQLVCLAQAIAEVMSGERSSGQLASVVTGPTYTKLTRWEGRYRAPVRPRVRRALLSSPREHVIEMCAVIDWGHRCRLLAIRVERPKNAKWAFLCTRVHTA